jgi:hypothetical protein
VIVAQHSPEADQGLLVQLVGAVQVAEGPAGLGEVVHRVQGLGVIVAKQSPPAG